MQQVCLQCGSFIVIGPKPCACYTEINFDDIKTIREPTEEEKEQIKKWLKKFKK